MALGWTVGIDVGGTFTDAIAKHRDGRTRTAKVASTPKDPSIALVDAFEELLREGVDAPDVGLVFHGTTVATNAMLTGRTSRVVLLATEGFRDVMAFRNGTKPLLYDLRQPRPNELVERDDRIEVAERVSGLGEVVVPLTTAEIDRVVDEVASRGPDAIAIAFLFSYLRDEHERALAEALRTAMPGVPVTASSDIAREFREYPRTATAVVNAALRPLVGRYVADAAGGLRAIGVEAPFLVMQSNGGCVPAERAEREAHRLLLSGPTAGVAGTIGLAARHGVDGVISLDMGGTSLDVCLVQDGVPPTTSTQTVQDHPILVPSVDVVTAGAGGGSIAEVDRAGRLRVGPQSAGADPGPAAYGRGGTDATVTDAHVVAGILGPTPLAGRLPLDVDEAERAVSRVAQRLDLEPMRAAEGIIAVATAHGVQALRRVSVERGLDPRRYALVAFGGAGPLHAALLARELGVARTVIPPAPGHFSALGMLLGDLRADAVRTHVGPLEPATIGPLFVELEAEAAAELEHEAGERRAERFARLRYVGQEHTLEVPLDEGRIDVGLIARLRERFDAASEETYAFRLPTAVEIVEARVSVSAARDERLEWSTDAAPAPELRAREVDLDQHGGVQRASVVERRALHQGERLAGPCIVEEPAATVLVLPGQSVTVDELANLVIEEDA